jgi:hypothetical protein
MYKAIFKALVLTRKNICLISTDGCKVGLFWWLDKWLEKLVGMHGGS